MTGSSSQGNRIRSSRKHYFSCKSYDQPTTRRTKRAKTPSVETLIFPQCPQRGTTAPPKFFCTGYSEDTGSECAATFRTKADWKRHEEAFHENLCSWICSDCRRIFKEGTRFWSHHKDVHKCRSCTESGTSKQSYHVFLAEVKNPEKVAWGCGFCPGNGRLFSSWKDRCNHMALSHFNTWDEASRVKGRSLWSDTSMVLGLLQRPQLCWKWETMLEERYGPELGDILFWNMNDLVDLLGPLQRPLQEEEANRLVVDLFWRAADVVKWKAGEFGMQMDLVESGVMSGLRDESVFDRPLQKHEDAKMHSAAWEAIEHSRKSAEGGEDPWESSRALRTTTSTSTINYQSTLLQDTVVLSSEIDRVGRGAAQREVNLQMNCVDDTSVGGREESLEDLFTLMLNENAYISP